ncbi:putative apbE-like lipoprotein [Brucella thiophenivorans]|uniref:Putative apbE-like lipoprotein n=1 Tax=Brucella thiophenivorans TaxID=571255 RepID=A0A256FK18_9HYPH|nr:putative apbE-like lipoprotein [Brucella thiophenivorans]
MDCGALTISVKGADGLTTELVSSAEGCGMRLSMPELDVQPTRAVQARVIADTTEKRMIPLHKTQASAAKRDRRNAIDQHPQRSPQANC